MNVKMVFLLEENRPDEVIAQIRLKILVCAIFFIQGKGGSVIVRKDGYQRFG